MRRALLLLAACGTPPPTPASPRPAPTADVPIATRPSSPAKDYPASRKDDVVDTLYGAEVADPYRWLEDPAKPEVAAWMTAQDDYARARIAKLPHRDEIAKRIAEVFYYDSIGAPEHRKDRYFYTRKHKDKEKRVVYWKQGDAGPEKVLLDPNTWSSDGSTGLRGYSPSWDGNHVAYSVSEHNADEATMKILDVATGKTLADTIPGVRFHGASWSPDGSGFYYTYTPPASDTIAVADRNAHSEVRFHKLGGDPAKDAVIYPATGHPDWFVGASISEDGHWLSIFISHGSSGSTSIFYKDTRKAAKDWTTLVDGIDAHTSYTDYKDRFYVETNDGAPRSHIFVVDPKKPARADWKEIVKESDATLQGFSLVGGHLVLTYLRDVQSEMEIHDLDGKLVRKVDLPPLGSASGMLGRPGEDTAYFAYGSFTEPGLIYKTSIKTGKVDEWSRVTLPIELGALTAEQVRYKSKDGTEIPMFVIHRKDAPKDGKRPTLLTGYGGFRISLTPDFNPVYALWVERGGVVAIPSLRGGGEYGEDWHKAGMLANKQNVFDDFIGAAHALVDSGWTSHDKLAVFGGSNGGLLMGAITTQAPDAVKAVVCAVPLLDMVRYHKFGLGKAWISEYGSADDPEQFKALYGYSPYHHVKDGTRYPALLMLSSDHDDRVDPMHARKLTAMLQAATSSDAPIWLRIEKNAGHGGADVVRQKVDQWADTFAFLFAQLGM